MPPQDAKQDALLLSQYLESGDERAFERLVANHATMMTATATRICGSDDAPDAIQAALVTFANKAATIRSHNSVGAWLHRVVTLEAMNLRRRHIRQKEKKNQLTEAMKRIEVTAPSGLAEELDTTINSLNAKDREVVVLHYLEGQSFRTIAHRLGGTEAAWQKRCVRALKKLSQKLRLRGIVVPTTTLAAFFASQPSEAAASQILCQKLATQALAQKGLTLGSSSATLFTLMNAKLATLLTFGTGLALSTGWAALRHNQNDEAAHPTRTTLVSGTSADQTPRPFSREREEQDLFSALAKLDQQEEANTYLESSIRAAIFELSISELPELIAFLHEAEHPDRFQQITAACYARWTEHDAEAAWEVMLLEERYRWQAQRAVVQTWIHLDSEAALAKIAQEKKKPYRDAIWAYVKRFAGIEPATMADFLILYDQHWPTAAEKLFPVLARAWAMEDPSLAGQWIASYEDVSFREGVLEKLTPQIARERGRLGLELADLITDPKKRQAARMQALRWWAISKGIVGVRPNTRPDREEFDLTSGVPDSWTPAELRQFSVYFMINFSKYSDLMVAIAQTPQEQETIYQGILAGSAYSDPAIGAQVIPQLSTEFLTSAQGQKDLKTVFARWQEQDPETVQAWLLEQPSHQTTEIIRTLIP